MPIKRQITVALAAGLTIAGSITSIQAKADPCEKPQGGWQMPPEWRNVQQIILAEEINGTGGRGGGQGVYLQDGSFRFLDAIQDGDLNKIVAAKHDPKDYSNTCDQDSVKKLVLKDDENAALKKHLDRLSQSEPELAKLIQRKVDILISRGIRFGVNLSKHPNYADWKDSRRVPKDKQNPVALFTGIFFGIQDPDFSRMSPDDRATALIHEASRQILIDYQSNPSLAYDLKAIEETSGKIARDGNLPEKLSKEVLPVRDAHGVLNTIRILESKFGSISSRLSRGEPVPIEEIEPAIEDAIGLEERFSILNDSEQSRRNRRTLKFLSESGEDLSAAKRLSEHLEAIRAKVGAEPGGKIISNGKKKVTAKWWSSKRGHLLSLSHGLSNADWAETETKQVAKTYAETAFPENLDQLFREKKYSSICTLFLIAMQAPPK